MFKNLVLYTSFIFFFWTLTTPHLLSNPYQSLNKVPVCHQGRIRPTQSIGISSDQLWKDHLKNIQHSKDELNFKNHFQELLKKGFHKNEIAVSLEDYFPFYQRITTAPGSIFALPGKFTKGNWLSLEALNVRVYDSKSNQLILAQNFTLYPDELFEKIQKAYISLKQSSIHEMSLEEVEKKCSELSCLLIQGYNTLFHTQMKKTLTKTLSYPSWGQLYAEGLYTKYPWVLFAISGYTLALTMYFARRKLSINFYVILSIFLFSLLLHTGILIMRCYILWRPPVSNMYETLLYVPWIAGICGWSLFLYFQKRLLIPITAMVVNILLLLIPFTGMTPTLDTVQPVLDSQFWLTIHVLMVVGSYGFFSFAAILGHLYLVTHFKRSWVIDLSKMNIPKLILQTTYLGVILLITGTLLGGVWAHQSWGRFWDWDPKESWAFISACTYLVIVHAYRFNHIKDFGLAVGSIIGWMAISFTWYGVNYILGTGLHSYGFGQGGEWYYFTYLTFEILFLGCSVIQRKKLT